MYKQFKKFKLNYFKQVTFSSAISNLMSLIFIDFIR